MSSRALLSLLACACCLLLANTALARNLYVNNLSGDDRHDGRAPIADTQDHGPFRTIDRAMRAARKGDHVVIANTGTPYRESMTVQGGRNSGLATRPFVIQGNGAVLDGTRDISPDVWKPVQKDLYRFTPEYKSLLIFNGGRPAPRVRASEDSLPSLEPLEWCLYKGDVYFRGEENKLPEDYPLTQTSRQVGITVYEARHVFIADLVIQGYRLDGVNAHDGTNHVELVGLICRGNGRSGISVGGASRLTIRACLVGNNGRAQLRTEGHCRARVINCDLIDDDPQAPAMVKTGGQITVEQSAPPREP
jgi:hypothetical protein